MEGIEIAELALPYHAYKIVASKFTDDSSIIAITLYNLQQILIYKIKNLEFELLQDHKFDDQIVSVTFSSTHEELFVCCNLNNETILIKKLSSSDNYKLIKNDENLNKILKENVKVSLLNQFNDISLMFKKKFDNVKDYHERKRKRIENKN